MHNEDLLTEDASGLRSCQFFDNFRHLSWAYFLCKLNWQIFKCVGVRPWCSILTFVTLWPRPGELISHSLQIEDGAIAMPMHQFDLQIGASTVLIKPDLKMCSWLVMRLWGHVSPLFGECFNPLSYRTGHTEHWEEVPHGVRSYQPLDIALCPASRGLTPHMALDKAPKKCKITKCTK